MSKAKDYSSQSFSPSSSGRTKSQPTGDKVNSAGKSQEKDDMVGLNDKFVRLIDKVCKSQLLSTVVDDIICTSDLV